METPITVLHVDDDSAFANLSATYLQREDERIDVVAETNVEDAVRVLDAAEPAVDCIVSDYDMPGLNGLEFLESVRRRDEDLPFILFTGKGSEEIASEAIAAGVTDYLQKSGTEQYPVLANRIVNAVEQYRSARTVERTERRLRELADKSNDILWIYNGAWDEVIFINSAVEDITGISPEQMRADPRRFLESTHPDDRDRVERAMRRVAAGESVDVEYRVNKSEDYGRWAWAQAKPVFDETGSVDRIVGFVRDITERKERERALAESEAKFRILAENLDGMVWISDPDSRQMRYLNPTYEEIWGRDRESVYDDPTAFLDGVHPDDRDPVERAYDALPAEDFDEEYRVVRPNGEVRWVAARAGTVGTDAGDRIVGIAEDITERKRRERALAAINDVAVDLDALDSIEAISERTIEASQEILDFDMSVIDIEEDGTLTKAAVSKDISPINTATMSVEEGIAGRTYRSGRSMIVDDIDDHPDANPQGPYRSAISIPIGTYGVFQAAAEETGAFDETDLELAELLVNHTSSAFDRIERERRLRRQNERLEEFSRIVSHDLRNPLNVLEGYLELASEDTASEHVEAANGVIERMEEIVDDTLTLATAGQIVDEMTPVDLEAIARSCWGTVASESATLAVTADATIRADPGRLRHVLENLYRNAVEHGGSDVTVRVGTLPDGFFVEDDGSGIPEGEGDRLFEPGTTGNGGSGVGLMIVRQVVEAHGWSVRVTEGADGGARFEFSDVEMLGDDAPPQPTAENQ